MAHLYVLVQFVSILLLAWFGDLWPDVWLPRSLVIGGIALGLWAVATMRLSRLSIFPAPLESGQLITQGPYHWIRHPMYTSVLLVCAGWAVSAPTVWTLLVFMVLTLNLFAKARYEEGLLLAVYPDYAPYRDRTARFVPFLF